MSSTASLRLLPFAVTALAIAWTPGSIRGSDDDLAAEIQAVLKQERMRIDAPSRRTGEFGLATLPRKRPPLKPDPPGTYPEGITRTIKGRIVLMPYPPRDRPDTGPDYAGTKIVPDPKCGKDVAEFQKRFADQFNRLDPCPAGRTAHFSWLPHYEGLRHVGRWGRVLASALQPDGTWSVRIQIRPQLYTTRMKTNIEDYVEETYRVRGEEFALIGSDAEIPKTDRQIFPLP